MVRLKVLENYENIKLNSFQFHYGTIKRLNSSGKCGKLRNFNSTMVRLKVISVVEQSPASLFQFHYGTIKRVGEP